MEETLIKFASILISVASVLSIILTIILQVFKNAKVNKRNKLLEENNSDKDKEIDGLKSEIENINKYIEIIGTVIPYTFLGNSLGMSRLPYTYFPWLLGIVVCYMVLATIMKSVFRKHYGELL